jgi:hypothetical protein
VLDFWLPALQKNRKIVLGTHNRKLSGMADEGRLFCAALAQPNTPYLQQLDLQQSEHLPSAHFWQELQEVLQQLLQSLALSAAVALAKPSPAIIASIAPALINVFICI